MVKGNRDRYLYLIGEGDKSNKLMYKFSEKWEIEEENDKGGSSYGNG